MTAPSPAELLELSALSGLSAGGLASLLRVGGRNFLPLGRLLRWRDAKPLECPVCLGGWTANFTTAAWWYLTGFPISFDQLGIATGLGIAFGVWLTASGIAAWIVTAIVPPPVELP